MKSLIAMIGMLLVVAVPLAKGGERHRIGSNAAEVKLPPIFADNMVLQRDRQIPVWGWARPAERVTVRFKNRTAVSTADANGAWRVGLAALPASADAAVLTVGTAKQLREFKNVLVGDVWLCSGQSNMAASFEELKLTQRLAGAENAAIRLANGMGEIVPVPRELFFPRNGWVPCTPESAKRFSCVGYYFGLKLWQELRIPIGLIDASMGCSSIEAWMPPESFSRREEWSEALTEMERMRSLYPRFGELDAEERERLLLAHCASKYGAFARGRLEGGRVRPEAEASIWWHMRTVSPAALYTHAIRPLIPFAIRGAIWYQGETNINDLGYAEKQQALVESWRGLWKQGDFPFYFVQIAPYKGYANLPEFWLQQYAAAKATPQCALAPTVDIGDIDFYHPLNKWDVGFRLASLALRNTYERKGVVACGPSFKSMSVSDGEVTIEFDNAGSGLTTGDGKTPNWFEVAAANGPFRNANCTIRDDAVIVSHPDVREPVMVRYAWNCRATPNLCNREGWPAMPFPATRAGENP